MMYLFDFVKFLWQVLSEGFEFLGQIGSIGLNCANSLLNVVNCLPGWVALPFFSLIAISVLFRVSQFIPTIGGAN